MQKLPVLFGCGLLAVAHLSFAETQVPDSGFFAGLGGSYNAMQATDGLDGIGISNVLDGPVVVASGQAGGPASPITLSQKTFAPLIQAGYFQHFNHSNWLWGVKGLYQYLNANPIDSNISVPQAGEFTPRGGVPDDFTGYVSIDSIQTTVSHEFALIPFIGHSFQNAYVYAGAGPALFDTKTSVNNGIGYATVNGDLDDLTGAPVNFSKSKWVWAGMAELGLAYYIDPTFFIDASYTVGVSQNYTVSDSAPFTSTFSSGGTTYTSQGTFYFDNYERIITQSIMLSINKVF